MQDSGTPREKELTPFIPSPTSVIIGARGQDGTWLARELEGSGTRIIKIARGDINFLEESSARGLFHDELPHDVYFLAAVHGSSESGPPKNPAAHYLESLHLHGAAPALLLDCLRQRNASDRFFFASSSRVFGMPRSAPQNEETPLAPRCIYGITKAAGMAACEFFRREHGIHAVCGILYNHESSLRPATFLSKKIARAVAEISAGHRAKLSLINLQARVDWSHARDAVRGMMLALQAKPAQDYVISSGQTHSVQDFAKIAFETANLDWRDHVISESPGKAPEVELRGDPSRLSQVTGWFPEVSFPELVRSMVEEEIAAL